MEVLDVLTPVIITVSAIWGVAYFCWHERKMSRIRAEIASLEFERADRQAHRKSGKPLLSPRQQIANVGIVEYLKGENQTQARQSRGRSVMRL